MARDSSGTQNQPQYSSSGASSQAADLSEVANYAAAVGNRKVGTDSQRTGLSGADLWNGLEFICTDTGKIWIYVTGTGWTFVTQIPTAWTNLTLATGWNGAVTGWAAVQYRLNAMGEVEIRGQLTPKSGYLTTDVFATLPVGYRPPAQIALTVMNNAGSPAIAEVVITSAGAMSLFPAGVGNVNFGQLSFATV